MEAAKLKADSAFDMFRLLGVPYFAWHDLDIRPEGRTFAESRARLEEIIDYIQGKMSETGIRCLWGTANMFTHRRWMAGAATNPDPNVFLYAAATVKACIDATHKLGARTTSSGAGARATRRCSTPTCGRSASRRAVPEHGRGLQAQDRLQGTILIEPKPQEPSKHQYDYDVGPCTGFLKDFGLESEVKCNIEQGHAILAGTRSSTSWRWRRRWASWVHRHEPERLPVGLGHGPVPTNVPEMALAYYEVLRAGGFTTGGPTSTPRSGGSRWTPRT
jgi:xylose isomerase